MGFVHFCVQLDIIIKNPELPLGIECWVRKDDTLVGRADIVNLSTGEMWEVKSELSSSGAEKQLNDYLGGTIVRNGKSGLFVSEHEFKGEFTINCGGYQYTVNYGTPRKGVVTYSVSWGKRITESVPAPDYEYEKKHMPKISPSTEPIFFVVPTPAPGIVPTHGQGVCPLGNSFPWVPQMV